MATDFKFDGGLTCALGVRDINESVKWYDEKLGFELAYKMDDIGWAEVKSSVDRVFIGFSQVDKVETKGGPTLTFGVKDIEKARKTLEQQGVRFDGEIVEYPGMVKLTTFYDPDGHKLMFYQSLSNGQQ
ncbi:MAG: VOC family protein [Phycisphaerales bacterium]